MLGMGNKVGQRSKIPISLLFISLPITPCKASSNGSLKAPPDCSPSDTFQAAAAAGVTDVTATEELSRPPLQEYGSRRPHCRRCGNPNCFPTSIVGPVEFRRVSSERDSAIPFLSQKQGGTSVPTTSHEESSLMA